MNKNCAIILAAGEGKRMASNIPKVLCEVLFKPMLGWVMDACENSNINDNKVQKNKIYQILKQSYDDTNPH